MIKESDWVEFEGERIRLRDVPKDRRAEVVVEIDGQRVRPFRFVAVDDDPFVVVR